MARSDNPVLGHYTCKTCGESSEVLQAKRGAGRFLYRRGCACGTDQRNGAKVQTEWWNNTVWMNGEPDTEPANLIKPDDDLKIQGVNIDDSQPENLPDVPEKENGSGFSWLLGGAVALLALLSGRV